MTTQDSFSKSTFACKSLQEENSIFLFGADVSPWKRRKISAWELTTWPKEMFCHQGFSSIWSGCMKGLRLSISLNRFWLPAPLKGLAALLAFTLEGVPKGLLPDAFPKGEAAFPATNSQIVMQQVVERYEISCCSRGSAASLLRKVSFQGTSPEVKLLGLGEASLAPFSCLTLLALGCLTFCSDPSSSNSVWKPCPMSSIPVSSLRSRNSRRCTCAAPSSKVPSS